MNTINRLKEADKAINEIKEEMTGYHSDREILNNIDKILNKYIKAKEELS